MGVESLKDRVAVVTAAAGAGLGGSIVRRLVEDGVRVVASDMHEGRLRQLTDELGIEGGVVDVSDSGALERHLESVLSTHGRVDVLVNCAGTNALGRISEIDLEDWRRVFSVNLDAAFVACRAVIPTMLTNGRGSIINITSTSAWAPANDELAYSSSKSALAGFTRALARSVAGTGVRANAVAPSLVDNPFLAKVYGEDKVAEMAAELPMGRPVRPDEVAAVVAWLASDESSYISGETLGVTGSAFLRP